jgi:Bax protein
MKQHFVHSKIVARIAISIAIAGFISACGGGFHTPNPLAADVRPPATSDPLTAEDMRLFEAEQKGEKVTAPILETDKQRKAFLQEMLEQAPAYSDQELADDAQQEFDKREKERAQKPQATTSQNEDSGTDQTDPGAPVPDVAAPDQVPPASGRQSVYGDLPTKSAESTITATAKENAAAETPGRLAPYSYEGAKTVPFVKDKNENPQHVQYGAVQPQVAKSAAPQAGQNTTPQVAQGAVTAQNTAPQVTAPPAETKAPEVSPAAPATTAAADTAKPAPAPRPNPKRPVPKVPTSTVHSEFCDGLNVTSGQGEADLSALYNSTAGLTSAMPKDLDDAHGLEKKNQFVCALLPVAIRMNEEVFRQRLEVLRLQAKQQGGVPLTKDDEQWLANIKVAYNLTAQDSTAALLKQVDIVPLSLLLAQGALESGWGTSRATKDLKNLFGIHASKGQPCKTGYDTNNACVRQFKTIGESVSAYIRLLNVGKYYTAFREARAKMRTANKALDSVPLLSALNNYNEKPNEYFKLVRQIMSGSNKLTQYVFDEDQVSAKN